MSEVPEIVAKFVHEKTGQVKDTYSEYEPTWLFGKLYPNRYALVQAFGEVPDKIEIIIRRITK